MNRDGKEARTVGNVKNVSFISQEIVRNSRLEEEGGLQFNEWASS